MKIGCVSAAPSLARFGLLAPSFQQNWINGKHLEETKGVFINSVNDDTQMQPMIELVKGLAKFLHLEKKRLAALPTPKGQKIQKPKVQDQQAIGFASAKAAEMAFGFLNPAQAEVLLSQLDKLPFLVDKNLTAFLLKKRFDQSNRSFLVIPQKKTLISVEKLVATA